jgi:FMN-dependent oxidoreductase (nitrilotriacetate monooxygenase family)
MKDENRTMHLAVFALGTGNHPAGWRMNGSSVCNSSWETMQSIARTAERGKFDLFFIADTLSMDPTDHPAHISRFEPISIIAALSAITRDIGLGATVSTTFGEPYHVARAFSSVDHISGGRAAWNVVTTSMNAAALNFSGGSLDDHDHRYEMASEFVDVVRGLWDTWTDNALVADKETGVFVDTTRVRELNHRGKFYSVKGPLNIERSPQGHPLIIQAGGSSAGLNLSARVADLVFSVVQDPEAAKDAYDNLKKLAVGYGRRENDVRLLPGVMPIVGKTSAEARSKLNQLQSWVTPTNVMTLVSQRIGHDISGYSLDEPVPDFPPTQKTRGFSEALLQLARKEKMTLRELYNVAAAARGHWVLCGTPSSIADTLEEWFVEKRADGFMILPAYFPQAFDEFVDLVVPELQRRGLFRREYGGVTLRERMGLRPRHIG